MAASCAFARTRAALWVVCKRRSQESRIQFLPLPKVQRRKGGKAPPNPSAPPRQLPQKRGRREQQPVALQHASRVARLAVGGCPGLLVDHTLCMLLRQPALLRYPPQQVADALQQLAEVLQLPGSDVAGLLALQPTLCDAQPHRFKALVESLSVAVGRGVAEVAEAVCVQPLLLHCPPLLLQQTVARHAAALGLTEHSVAGMVLREPQLLALDPQVLQRRAANIHSLLAEADVRPASTPSAITTTPAAPSASPAASSSSSESSSGRHTPPPSAPPPPPPPPHPATSPPAPLHAVGPLGPALGEQHAPHAESQAAGPGLRPHAAAPHAAPLAPRAAGEGGERPAAAARVEVEQPGVLLPAAADVRRNFEALRLGLGGLSRGQAAALAARCPLLLVTDAGLVADHLLQLESFLLTPAAAPPAAKGPQPGSPPSAPRPAAGPLVASPPHTPLPAAAQALEAGDGAAAAAAVAEAEAAAAAAPSSASAGAAGAGKLSKAAAALRASLLRGAPALLLEAPASVRQRAALLAQVWQVAAPKLLPLLRREPRLLLLGAAQAEQRVQQVAHWLGVSQRQAAVWCRDPALYGAGVAELRAAKMPAASTSQ